MTLRIVDESGQDRDFFWEIAKYAGHLWRSHLTRHWALTDLYRRTLEVPGSVAEFGLYHGATFFLLARLLETFHPGQHEVHASSGRHLYGFDTFAGFPDVTAEDLAGTPHRQHVAGGLAGSRAEFFDTFDQLRASSAIARRLHVVEGDVCETFPAWLEANAGVRFAFALIDFDIFAPTQAVLARLASRLVPGAIVVFDEYGFPEWPGETRAVDAFVRAHQLTLHSIPWTFAPAAYCVWPGGVDA